MAERVVARRRPGQRAARRCGDVGGSHIRQQRGVARDGDAGQQRIALSVLPSRNRVAQRGYGVAIDHRAVGRRHLQRRRGHREGTVDVAECVVAPCRARQNPTRHGAGISTNVRHGCGAGGDADTGQQGPVLAVLPPRHAVTQRWHGIAVDHRAVGSRHRQRRWGYRDGTSRTAERIVAGCRAQQRSAGRRTGVDPNV